MAENNRIKEELEKQEFYKSGKESLSKQYNSLSSLGGDFNDKELKSIKNALSDCSITEDQEKRIPLYIKIFKEEVDFNYKIIDWFTHYISKNEFLNKDELDYVSNSINEFKKFEDENKHLIKKLDETYKEYTDNINEASISIDGYSLYEEPMNGYFEDDIYVNQEGQTMIGDTFGRINFDTLISNADNSALQSWYKFLQDLHESPIKSFTLNKNTICNFKLIFKNPYTGLTTDKEIVVSLSHSTSSKKTPVFSIGSVSYKATSTGVKLLAGSLVTAALDNVPLPYLHAISYMNHSSVEDLPPLDLYIIPIENISENGRYEVLLIKGIQFVDMKQNDNASSTGVYYAFNYFAEDIVPLDFSESEKYFKIQYDGNNNL